MYSLSRWFNSVCDFISIDLNEQKIVLMIFFLFFRSISIKNFPRFSIDFVAALQELNRKSNLHRKVVYLVVVDFGTWRWLCTFNKMLQAENRMFCDVMQRYRALNINQVLFFTLTASWWELSVEKRKKNTTVHK